MSIETFYFLAGVASTVTFLALALFGCACAAMSKRPSAVQIARKQMRADADRLKRVAS